MHGSPDVFVKNASQISASADTRAAPAKPKTPMTKTIATPVAFEPEFIAGVKTIFEEKIVFNHVLGLKVVSLAPERVVARIDMKP